jgi:hypothetical protein
MRARLWRVAQRRAERMALDVVMAGLVPAIHVFRHRARYVIGSEAKQSRKS